MLSMIPYLVLLVMVCLIGDLIALRPEGVIRRQWDNLTDIRQERSFGDDNGKMLFGHILMIGQWSLCCGLILYTNLDAEYFEDLRQPDQIVWNDILLCSAIPAAWWILQWILYHWCASLFHENGKAHILTRVYSAIHILSAPVALLIFMAEVTGILSATSSGILLLLFFIFAHLVFILSSIRIFWNGFSTLFIIFLYLCAFKIAPLLLIMAKLG